MPFASTSKEQTPQQGRRRREETLTYSVLELQNESRHLASYEKRKSFMSDLLDKTIGLVLNRNWQAIKKSTPASSWRYASDQAASIQFGL